MVKKGILREIRNPFISKVLIYFIAFMVVSGLALLIQSFTGSHDGDKETRDDCFYTVRAVKIPQNLEFAGEKVPVENFDTRESLDMELLINAYWHSQTFLLIKKANRYFPAIEKILKEYNVPDDFKYLAIAESGLTNVISPRKAVGFWQLLEETAKDYGLEVSKEVDERYDPEKSTRAACRFILESYEKYNSWTLAAASFNAGVRGIDRQIERQKETSYYDLLLPDETARYIFRAVALKIVMTDPEKYGFYLDKSDLYPEIPCHTVEVDSSITDMADFAKAHLTNYKMLKFLNPWLRESYLTNKNGKTYIIKIPDENSRTFSVSGKTE
jgi:membrane-bound lytic murein transglycosylase D